jgi:hypothetical protein
MPLSQVAASVAHVMSDIKYFSKHVLKLPLYRYQLEPLNAILDSIYHKRGYEFLLVFSRQSGKNEAAAHLLVFLLNMFQRTTGNIVYAATGDGLGRGLQRLDDRLNNPWNRGAWRRGTKPTRRILGQTAVVFISAHPQASTRGETAHHLLVIDELQDQHRAHIEAVFTPMRAAHNATALYLGTVRTSHDALWLKKQELERLTADDGVKRVFFTGPDLVTAENKFYGRFLEDQVKRHGRHHPIIASEYYLEPLDTSGGLFPPRRITLMHGTHSRRRQPDGKTATIALLDVGGQDEAATDPIAYLDNPGRDYTICTIIDVIEAEHDQGRIYHAIDVFVDHGSRHFTNYPEQPSLALRLLAYLNHWRVSHLVADETGVGEGLTDWLAQRLERSRVTGFKFSARSKAQLGSTFLALIETGRFKYWSDDAEKEYSDGWWFWTQCAHCTYDLPPGAQFEKDLRWHVPPSAKISTPNGLKPIHDDRLLSAALVAEADRLVKSGDINLGIAQSIIIDGENPLDNLNF